MHSEASQAFKPEDDSKGVELCVLAQLEKQGDCLTWTFAEPAHTKCSKCCVEFMMTTEANVADDPYLKFMQN
jgi:hypothetical protein